MNTNSISMHGWSSDPAKCKCDFIFNPAKPTEVSFHEYGAGRIQTTVVDTNYVCDICLTNSLPRAPNVDKCIFCRMVEHNLEEKIWIRRDDDPKLHESTKFTKWPMDSLENISENVPILNRYYKNLKRPFRKHEKPLGRWFSAGTWLYNTYGDLHSCVDY